MAALVASVLLSIWRTVNDGYGVLPGIVVALLVSTVGIAAVMSLLFMVIAMYERWQLRLRGNDKTSKAYLTASVHTLMMQFLSLSTVTIFVLQMYNLVTNRIAPDGYVYTYVYMAVVAIGLLMVVRSFVLARRHSRAISATD